VENKERLPSDHAGSRVEDRNMPSLIADISDKQKLIPTSTTIKFNIDDIDPTIKKSPIALRDWLNVQIPWLIGPHIDSFVPDGGQRDTILTIQGVNFATERFANQVTIGGTSIPVLAASPTELKVLVTKDVDSGPLKVEIGTLSAVSDHDFVVKGYPDNNNDGPPVFAIGSGEGFAGDVNPIGTIRVLVVICQATDRVPSNLSNVSTTINDSWTNVQTFYTQASYGRTDVQFDIVNTAANLDGVFSDFVDLTGANNVLDSQIDRISAIAAKHAQDAGFTLNNYQMLCSVIFTDGAFIRGLGNHDTQVFSYDDGKPVSDPDHINIHISLDHKINLIWIGESANWGRFAHEFGHNIVSAPTETGDGTATLGEDVYQSDLVDPNAETAADFDLMGNHDKHPIFSGYHLEKLGYYNNTNIKEIHWNRNPHAEDVTIIAHGLSENTTSGRFHILKIKVSDALSYYVEVRQQPGAITQIFDDSIPLGMAPYLGGVIVTKVIAGQMHNNQQTRFITLMHDNRVQIPNDIIEDPARALRITVVNDTMQVRPLAYKIHVEWAQTVADDPNGAFDLNIDPWESNWGSPDIWVDRDPIGVFDYPMDGQGRPENTGDKPWVNHVNQFTARVHVSGAMGADNVKVTFYAITPPGVGDNGNWAPISIKTIGNIPQDGYKDIFCDWVPVVGKHTCLKVFVSQQFGEQSGGNNSAQENVVEFQADGSSPVNPLFIKTAVRNPLEERRAIHLSIHGLPRGWSAQIPHSWIWLDGKAEKEFDVVVWPIADVNAYKFGNNKQGELPATAPFNFAGFILRSYSKEMENSHSPPGTRFPGSRFYPIGGTFYRTDVRKKSTISIEARKEQDGGNLFVFGAVAPMSTDQQILVDLLLPDGKTHKTTESKTNSTGHLNVVISLLDDNGKLLSGSYKIQAFIFHATELADAESNILYITH
jgi:hypothetical protein